MPTKRLCTLVLVACCGGLGAEARAELTADELLLIYNTNSPTSKELAEYYAHKRSVPSRHLLGLDLPLTEELLRTDYDRQVVRPLRRYLWDTGLAARVRCLVTFYDVPLRVGPRLLTEAEKKRADWVRQHRDRCLAEIHGVINELHALVEGVEPEAKAHIKRPQTAADELAYAFAYYRKRLAQRLASLPDEKEVAKTRPKFLALAIRMDGLDGADGQVTAEHVLADQAVLQRLADLREGAQSSLSAEQVSALLKQGLMGGDYPRAIEHLQRRRGLIAAYRRLDRDRKSLDFEGSDAALDSELALLWWRPYRLVNQLFNWRSCRAKLQATNDQGVVRETYAEAVLMTCRLDGPGPEVVRRMIDHAIAVENTGLSGTVYVDRDPLRQVRENLWQVRALTRFIDLLRGGTSFPVVVEETQDLFAPGACPRTALYCGWHHPSQYVDAFEFVPGAVAYHLSSGEALSLRDPTATYWCKEILAQGAAATLGSTAEATGRGIPRPDEFFGLLMTGRYSLAEAFALANMYVSWRTVLLGDPLYQPFKVNAQLVVEDVLTGVMLPLDHSPERFSPLPKGPEDLKPWGPGAPGAGFGK